VDFCREHIGYGAVFTLADGSTRQTGLVGHQA